MIKLASNAFRDQGELHQRDPRTSPRRSAPTSTRSWREWASTGASARAPPAGRRLRRLVLSEERVLSEAPRREQRLRPAPGRGDGGERAQEEAARREQAARAPGRLARKDGSPCSVSPSSRTPTTCAMRRRSSSPPGSSPKERTCGPGTPSSRPSRVGRSRDPGVDARRGARGGRRRDRDRVAGAAGAGVSRDTWRRCGLRSSSTAVTCSTPRPCAPPVSGTRGSAEPEQERIGDVEAILLAGGKAERLGDAAGDAQGARRDRGTSAGRVPGRAARRRGSSA